MDDNEALVRCVKYIMIVVGIIVIGITICQTLQIPEVAKWLLR